MLQFAGGENVDGVAFSHKPHVKYVEGPFVQFLLFGTLVEVEKVAQVSQSYGLLLPLSIVLLGCLTITYSEALVDFFYPLFVACGDVPFNDILEGIVVHVLQVIFRL